MTKVLLTGRPGCGKTTTIQFLRDHGTTAFNTDDIDDATALQNIETGEIIAWPKDEVDWTKFAWNWQRPVLERLLAEDDLVILGGTASNQVKLYELFDYVFVLTVSPETLRHHLEHHEHDSHHLPGVIDRKVSRHLELQEIQLAQGGVPLDGNRPTSEIAQELLQRIGGK